MEIFQVGDVAGSTAYRRHMLRQVCEQPDAVSHAMAASQKDINSLARLIIETRRKILIGFGNSYNVALFGQFVLASLTGEFVPAIPSETVAPSAPVNVGDLILAISRSGRSMESIRALRIAKAGGASAAAIIGVHDSPLGREADVVIQQNLGSEKEIISTKVVMSQMVQLVRIAAEVAYIKRSCFGKEYLKYLEELAHLPKSMEITLQNNKGLFRKLALRYQHIHKWFVLGGGIYSPMAQIAAQLMRNITCFQVGLVPLSHINLEVSAAFNEETVSFFAFPPKENRELYEHTLKSVGKVQARKGNVVLLSVGDSGGRVDELIHLPKASAWNAPFLYLIAIQMLMYELSGVHECFPMDRPSLAKPITVA